VHKDTIEEEHWTGTITPTTGWLDIRLDEIWRYRDLLALFVKRDFVAQYKQTVLGPVWHVIQPLFTSLMLLLVFGTIAGVSTDGIKPSFLFFMSGITIWTYFSACLTGTSNTFVSNAAIFGKVYFPRLILPLSTIVSNLVKFGIQFGLLLVILVFCAIFKGESYYFGVGWLLIIPILFIMAGMSLGLGIIISAMTTKYRDLNVLVTFGVQLLMYVTPVAYPLSYLAGKKYAWFVKLNPLSPLVEGFRYAIFHKGSFDITSLGYSAIFMIIVLFIGIVLFNRVEKSFMDTV